MVLRIDFGLMVVGVDFVVWICWLGLAWLRVLLVWIIIDLGCLSVGLLVFDSVLWWFAFWVGL